MTKLISEGTEADSIEASMERVYLGLNLQRPKVARIGKGLKESRTMLRDFVGRLQTVMVPMWKDLEARAQERRGAE
jgi:hypothetical protein